MRARSVDSVMSHSLATMNCNRQALCPWDCQARILEWVAACPLPGVFLTQESNFPHLWRPYIGKAGPLPLAPPGKPSHIIWERWNRTFLEYSAWRFNHWENFKWVLKWLTCALWPSAGLEETVPALVLRAKWLQEAPLECILNALTRDPQIGHKFKHTPCSANKEGTSHLPPVISGSPVGLGGMALGLNSLPWLWQLLWELGKIIQLSLPYFLVEHSLLNKYYEASFVYVCGNVKPALECHSHLSELYKPSAT